MGSKAKDAINVHNYCACFIDLLGQRRALQGQGLLRAFATPEEEKVFLQTLKSSVGAIINLQDRAETMMNEATRAGEKSQLRSSLSSDQQAAWDRMHRSNLKRQYWSDGLVYYASLGDRDVECHAIEIFPIIANAGSLAFLGLAARQPIRGAIEIAWGVELPTVGLYGPVVATTYELESQIAGYPRIVVGREAYTYLHTHSINTDPDVFRQVDREFATLCLSMLMQDADGVLAIDYLGDAFRNAVTKNSYVDLYKMAHPFVHSQWQEHQRSGDSKLAFRYAHLFAYFEGHWPSELPREAFAGKE